MGFISNSTFAKNIFPFPDDNVDPKEKLESAWLLAAVKGIYGKYVQNETLLGYSNLEKFDVFRKYGQARQDPNKYKEIYKPTETGADHAAKGYVNLDFQIFSPVLKFKAVLRQKIRKMMARPQVRAIDELSGVERAAAKWDSYFFSINADIVSEFEQATGMEMDKPEFIPSSKQELEVYSEMNGFKLKSEMAYNRALAYTDEISEFEQIRRKIVDDIIDIGACCVKDYVDEEDGKVKIKYIDVARFVGDYSLNHNFDKSRYFGHFEDMKLHELRLLMPDVAEDEWKKLAYNYSGYGSNPGLGDWEQYDVQYDSDGAGGKKWSYDDYTIMVFEGEYKSVDTKYRIKHTNKYGDVKYYDDAFGKVRNTQSKQTVKRSVVNWYKIHWVVGSDHIYDSGLSTDVPRPKKSKPRSSYHPWRVPGKSFIELIMTNLDQIQLSYLRMQNAINSSAPDGLAIEWSSLENISIGDQETHPMELLRIHQQTGNLIYRATTHRGNVNMSSSKPIFPLQGGAGKLFEDSIRTMEMHFNWIAELTGIDRFSAGITPNPETSATASQIAAQGANDVVEDLAFAYHQIRESCAMNVVQRIALRVKHSKADYDIYTPSLGNNTEIIKLSADLTPQQMGIYMKMAPDDEQRQRITNAIQVSIQSGQIGIEDALKVERAASEGNMIYAESLLSKSIKLSKEKEQENQQANIEKQNEGLLQIKQQEAEGSAMKLEGEIQMATTIEKAKLESAIALENVKHKNKMEQIEAEKEYDNSNMAESDLRTSHTNEQSELRGTALEQF